MRHHAEARKPFSVCERLAGRRHHTDVLFLMALGTGMFMNAEPISALCRLWIE